MRFQFLLAAVLGCICSAIATSDNLTTQVTWDQYSLSVDGNRVFINSAEFHYQRMPSPALWLDIFQKFKANGFNAISIYFFWSYHSAAPGVFDFESPGKNLQQLFDTAKEAGLWVIARAGPYCNAETNGGGFALWGSDGSMGKLRTSDETYYQAWLPWVQQVGKIIAQNQITKGGPVILNQIENELQETTHSSTNTLVVYMEQIEQAFRDAGVIVPFTSNEKGMRSESWSVDYENVGGAVNVYGLDSYPGGFSCTNPNSGFNLVRTYYQWFSNYSFTQPSFLPEFEGGYFTPWGGQFYDQCQAEHQPAYADVYYKNNIGQRVTMESFYMTYGGTNWGHSAAPVVYTSYDYSAPLRETRQQWDKMYQTKLVNMFAASSPDLLKTEMIGNGTGFRVSSTAMFSWVLQNPDTGATFTVIQQSSSPSNSNISASVTLDTSAGVLTILNVELYGRQSKILVTDYPIGNQKLLYSSADVLTYAVMDVDVLVLYLKAGQQGQFAFKGQEHLTYQVYGGSSLSSATNGTIQSFTYTQAIGTTAVKFSNGILVYLLEEETAWKFWAPPTTPTITYPSANQKLFILGPYLVRKASVNGPILSISGDNDNSTTIEAYVGNRIIALIQWNGQNLLATRTKYGSYTAKIPGVEGRRISLPAFSGWKSANSLPEADPSYDDSKWIVCNKTTTKSPVAPLTLPVLFSSDYGYYTGAKVYRGYFDGLNKTSVDITCSGGLAFGWNAWLNGVFIGGDNGNASLTTTSAVLSLPSSALKQTNNILTVLVDYHGHDETSTADGVENPRGILGATLMPGGAADSTGFKIWKIQGNAGGNKNIDPIRGPMNEGGLYAERMGWFLPGFNPSSRSNSKTPFTSSTPLDGISKAGVQFYVTTFSLNLDSDLDVPLGISLSAPAGTVARVMIWINGYQYGKFVPHIGPQTNFPVPPGIINNRGENTIAVSLWAQTAEGAKLDQVQLFSYGAYQSDFGFAGIDGRALQPGWTDRSMYA